MRLRLAAIAILVLGLTFGVAGTASASSRTPTAAGGVTAVRYAFNMFGFNCQGVRTYSTGPHAFVKDVEFCTAPADAVPPGIYDLSDYTTPIGEWCSDFEGYPDCRPAISGTILVIQTSPTTSIWLINANYAP